MNVKTPCDACKGVGIKKIELTRVQVLDWLILGSVFGTSDIRGYMSGHLITTKYTKWKQRKGHEEINISTFVIQIPHTVRQI
jgi:hypothetical protein